MTEYQNAVERLNRLGERWGAAKGEGDAGKGLQEEIFTLALSIFGKVRLKNTDFSLLEGMVAFIEQDWSQFDAAKGSLYGFFRTRLHNRAVSEYRRQRKDALCHADSLDAPALPGEETDAPSLLNNRGQEDKYPSLHGRRVPELLTTVISFQERLRGRSNNPERRNYFRMFFTDGVSDALRNGALEPEDIPRERELFEAMKTEFLDYFLSEPCRTAAAIRDCPPKAYGELVPGRPMSEPKRPLPNDVYVAYLNGREGKALKSEATITNQRNAYKLFLHELLGDAQAF